MQTYAKVRHWHHKCRNVKCVISGMGKKSKNAWDKKFKSIALAIIQYSLVKNKLPSPFIFFCRDFTFIKFWILYSSTNESFKRKLVKTKYLLHPCKCSVRLLLSVKLYLLIFQLCWKSPATRSLNFGIGHETLVYFNPFQFWPQSKHQHLLQNQLHSQIWNQKHIWIMAKKSWKYRIGVNFRVNEVSLT